MMTTKRLTFDIETEPFSQSFLDADSEEGRIKHAPKMRVACVFDESKDEYKYYTPDNSDALIKELLSADEVISFNGKGFDLLVLKKHHGLNGRVPKKGEHIDIHFIMTDAAGFRVSLDKAVNLNFGERKHTNGREMEALALDDLKIACQSDVSQTYRLWLAHMNEKLVIPQRTGREWSGSENRDVAPGHHMPNECPHCHDVGSLKFIEWDTEEMTEGQFADYISGLYGSAACQTCSYEIDFGF
ncbi:MAG: hypothetical protein PHU06_03065 [Gallionella sp.]|nr:hypothetical protein [Gallionella sp.]MDD4958234.1 hypothetical protein [Gallionella sp.]